MAGRKTIGLWSAISIGVGGMVGAGIFSILGTACQIGGNTVYISFVLAGTVALFSTYSYAKLGGRYPSAGGPVEFLIRSFGPGILSGGFNILLWVGYVLALALYSRAFASYALTLFHNPSPLLLHVFMTGIVVLFMLLNLAGSQTVGKSELIIVTIKVGLLVLFAGTGFFFIKPDLLTISASQPTSNVFFAAAIVFLAYEGFGLITNAAEDMENPRKTLPRALYLSVAIVILIYVGVSIAVIGNLPLGEIVKAKDFALAEAAKPFLGATGFTLVAIAALFSTSSAINATLFGGANVSYLISRDGELPASFDRKIWRTGREGLIITVGLVIVLSNLFDLTKIAMMGSASFLIIYGVVNIGHIRLRKETGGSLFLIWMAIVGNFASLLVLGYYLLKNAPATLLSLGVILILCFSFEALYRAITRRELKPRDRVTTGPEVHTEGTR